jgi:hypothetical protein
MQAVESQSLILYHTDLRGEWPRARARAFATRLPYLRRLAVSGGGAAARSSLAGIALAVRALSHLLDQRVGVEEIRFVPGQKPRLAPRGTRAGGSPGAPPGLGDGDGDPPPDFSISHSGPWVGCAALTGGRVGFDLEWGTSARIRDWVVREATLKATGEGVRAAREVRALEWADGVTSWRGEHWHVERVELFAGASAAVVSSRLVRAVGAQAIALEELFAA